MILGLTGVMGSGKSTVAAMLRAAGAAHIDADVIAREVVAPGTAGFGEVVAAFGAGVVGADGALDRKALGAIVFKDPAAKKRLEAIIHPRVRDREVGLIAEHRRAGAPLIVLDVPLLFESGAEGLCDAVLVVVVRDEVRIHRLTSTRGMTHQEVTARDKAQWSQEQKAARADFVLDNSGTLEDTQQQVLRLYQQLTQGT